MITVDSLSKKFRINHEQPKGISWWESLRKKATTPLRNLRHGAALGSVEDFWALRDVSFNVSEGEAVGIIGRNGAGKSTLLKILSRIMEPTSGCALLRGRVASLLEVGTGFHPELTGRDNVLLNGSILGMSRSRIKAKFDEIVAFSGVEKFIDTPVKRYSSGMKVRLAFAVAAHLDPEILIIDEVLAVGDSDFQKKCLGKMQDVGKEGRTVLFVSHNMMAVTRLCPRAILLKDGRLIADDLSHRATHLYLQSDGGISAQREWKSVHEAPGSEIARLRALRARTEDGQIVEAFDIRKPIGIDVEFEVLEAGHVLMPSFHLINEAGIKVCGLIDQDQNWRRRARPTGLYVSTAWIPGNLLAEGMLSVGVALITPSPKTTHFFERDAVAFQVVDTLTGDSARGDFAGRLDGVIRPLLEWTTEYSPNGSRQDAAQYKDPRQ